MSTKYVTIETEKGRIVAELFERDCPGTVENFERLASEGFYDGTAVHSHDPQGLVGAGDPHSRDLAAGDPRLGQGGPGWTIPCEFVGNRRAHEIGALTMLTSGPNTGGSLFGIVLAENGLHDRDGAHTVFGKVVNGLEVARRLEVGDRLDRLWVEE